MAMENGGLSASDALLLGREGGGFDGLGGGLWVFALLILLMLGGGGGLFDEASRTKSSGFIF